MSGIDSAAEQARRTGLTIFFWLFSLAAILEGATGTVAILDPTQAHLNTIPGVCFALLSLITVVLALFYFSEIPLVFVIVAALNLLMIIPGIVAATQLPPHLIEMIRQTPEASFEIMINKFFWLKVISWAWIVAHAVLTAYGIYYLMRRSTHPAPLAADSKKLRKW